LVHKQLIDIFTDCVFQEEIDSGEILEQETVPVLPNDTVESLQERVKTAEHRAFPRALHNLAKQLIYREKCGGHCD